MILNIFLKVYRINITFGIKAIVVDLESIYSVAISAYLMLDLA